MKIIVTDNHLSYRDEEAWTAYDTNFEGDHSGYGSTPEEALRNFLENVENL